MESNKIYSANGVVLVSYTALTKKQINDLSASIDKFVHNKENSIKNQIEKLCETAGQLVSYSESNGTMRASLLEQLTSLYTEADDLKIWRVSPMWAASQYGSGASVVGVTAKNGIHVFESYYV